MIDQLKYPAIITLLVLGVLFYQYRFLELSVIWLILIMTFWVLSKQEVKNIGNQIAILAILAGILIFFTQRHVETDNTLNSVLAANKFNCSMANDFINESSDEELQSRVKSLSYVTDMYKENMGFIFKFFGRDGVNDVIRVIALMNASEGIINATRSLNIESLNPSLRDDALLNIKNYNEAITDRAREIKLLLKQTSARFDSEVCNTK